MFHQGRYLDSQGDGNFFDVDEGNVVFATLDAAHVGTVETSKISECLLGHVLLSPQFTHSGTEHLECCLAAGMNTGLCHLSDDREMTVLAPRDMIPINDSQY
jgi:hypothetical protein